MLNKSDILKHYYLLGYTVVLTLDGQLCPGYRDCDIEWVLDYLDLKEAIRVPRRARRRVSVRGV